MEDTWRIKSGDGHTLHGLLNHAQGDKPIPDSCIVIIHGLTGHPHEYLHERAADFFTAKGYDVIRPYLYGGENGRVLVECTLQTHAQDVNTILAQIKGQYRKLFLFGPRSGGPSIMFARPENITAVSLGAPSFNLPALWNISPPQELFGLYYVRFGGVDHLLGRDMVEEGKMRYNEQECLEVSKNFTAPIQVIGADESDEAELYAQCDLSWHSGYKGQKECVKITGADHMFVRGDSCDRLLDTTLSWFERF